MYRLIDVIIMNVVTSQTRGRCRSRSSGRRAMNTSATSVSPCSSRITLGGDMFEYSPWKPGTLNVAPRTVSRS